MFYLASMYSLDATGKSSSDIKIRDARAKYVTRRAAELYKAGTIVFSPIAHCHQMSIDCDLPKEFGWWETIDKHMIDLSDGIIVLDMKTHDGKDWKDSTGMGSEVAYAISKGLPVIYLGASDYKEDKPALRDRKAPSPRGDSIYDSLDACNMGINKKTINWP